MYVFVCRCVVGDHGPQLHVGVRQQLTGVSLLFPALIPGIGAQVLG